MALSILLHPPTALWRREALAASRGTFWVRMDGASSLRIYRVLPPRLDDRRRDGGGDAVRTAMRRAASFCEPGNADVRIAREPLVARLAANAVPGAQLGHRVQPPIPVRDEVQPFLHGVRLRPRHAHLPVGSLEECHPCCRSDLLPMYPVCTSPSTHSRPLSSPRPGGCPEQG